MWVSRPGKRHAQRHVAAPCFQCLPTGYQQFDRPLWDTSAGSCELIRSPTCQNGYYSHNRIGESTGGSGGFPALDRIWARKERQLEMCVPTSETDIFPVD